MDLFNEICSRALDIARGLHGCVCTKVQGEQMLDSLFGFLFVCTLPLINFIYLESCEQVADELYVVHDAQNMGT